MKNISLLLITLTFFSLSQNANAQSCREPSKIHGGGQSASCGPLIFPCHHGVVNYTVTGNEVAPGVYGPGNLAVSVNTVGGTNAIYLLNHQDAMTRGIIPKRYGGGHLDYWTRINSSVQILDGYDGKITIKIVTRTNFHYEGHSHSCGYVASQAFTLASQDVVLNIVSSATATTLVAPPPPPPPPPDITTVINSLIIGDTPPPPVTP